MHPWLNFSSHASLPLPPFLHHPACSIMSRLFTPELAAFYEGFYAEKGIKIVKGDVVSALEGADGKVGRGQAAGSGCCREPSSGTPLVAFVPPTAR